MSLRLRPHSWIGYVTLLGWWCAYPCASQGQSDPPLGADDVAGKYVGTVAGNPSKITISVARDLSVTIGGTFQDWKGKYDSTTSEVTAARKAHVEDFPQGPDWAKAMAAEKIEWTLTLQATIVNNVVTLRGNWDNKKISYSVGTKMAVYAVPNLIAVNYQKACNLRPGSVKWRDAANAEQQALEAAREAARRKSEFDAANAKVQKWNTDHANDNPPPPVPDALLRSASDAMVQMETAQRTAKDRSGRANVNWSQVAPPLSQSMRRSCEICTLSGVISALSGQTVGEAQVLNDAQHVSPPFDPKKGTVPATTIAVLKKYGFGDAENVINIDEVSLRRNLMCGPVLLNNKQPGGHSLFVYAFTFDGNKLVVKGWDPGNGTTFERTLDELKFEGWDGNAIVPNPYD